MLASRRNLSQNDRDVIAAIQAQLLLDTKEKGFEVKIGQKDASGVEGMAMELGLKRYSLKEGVEVMKLDDTPVWNEIPKSDIAGIAGANTQRVQESKVITDYDVPWPTVEYERGRNTKIKRSEKDLTLYGEMFGLEDSITEGARMEAKGFVDLDFLADLTVTKGLARQMDAMIIGSNRTAIGTPSAPVLAGAATGGGLSDGDYILYASALTLQGLLASAKSGYFGGATPISVNTTDAVGESDESAASNTITLSAGTAVQRLTYTLVGLSGAYGYNLWLKKDAGAVLWAGTTTALTGEITALGLTGTSPNSADATGNTNDGDGILRQLLLNYAPCEVENLDGAPFTFDGFGNCIEIKNQLRRGFKKHGTVPVVIYCDVDTFTALSEGAAANVPNWIVLQAALVGQLNKAWTGQGPSMAVGGAVVAVVHPLTGTIIPIRPHRSFPARTMAAWSYENPMPDSKEPNSVEWRWTKPMERRIWSPTDRADDIGVYGGGLVRCPWMGGAFLLQNCDAAAA